MSFFILIIIDAESIDIEFNLLTKIYSAFIQEHFIHCIVADVGEITGMFDIIKIHRPTYIHENYWRDNLHSKIFIKNKKEVLQAKIEGLEQVSWASSLPSLSPYVGRFSKNIRTRIDILRTFRSHNYFPLYLNASNILIF